MKFYTFLCLTCSLCLFQAQAQESQKMTPSKKLQDSIYYEIPNAPATYNAENIVSRMIDGLGYRYFWATKDLREEDLSYRPSEDSRTARETLDHLYGLSETILHTVMRKDNIRPLPEDNRSFAEKRLATLENLKKASDQLRAAPTGELEKNEVAFVRGERRAAFPFWNLLNGPLADAIYHVGQIVAYRRAAGNPIHPGVNVFMGKTKE